MGTEAIFAICIKVFCCGTPEEPVAASCVCAAVVFLTIEPEGKLAVFSICVSILHSNHCKENRCNGEISHRPISKLVSGPVFLSPIFFSFFWRILIQKCNVDFHFEILYAVSLSIGKMIRAEIITGNFERIT